MPRRDITPLLAQRYGQIAHAIGEAMQRKGLSPAQVNEALGKPRSAPGIYHWLKAKGAPTHEVHTKLAKILGIDAAALDWRLEAPGRPSTALVPVEPVKPVRATQARASAPPAQDTIVIEVGGYRVEVRKL